jgi:peptidoglycan/xylan/chitin deacetylase (PgdA/CDA1 family)
VIDFEELEARREARARRRRARVRRRRAVALVALAAGVVAVAVVATDGTSHPRAARHGSASRATPRHEGAARRPAPAAVPILMYHVIRPAPPGAPFPQLYVAPSEFAAQMQALKSAGWAAVTLDQVWAAWHHGGALPSGRPVVISFDNGYESQFNVAMPVLRRLHWVAVENIQLSGLPRSQGGLSREATRRLVAAGWELDTQGFTHADLARLGPAALRREVATSRRVIERRFGVPVNWFCYPSGHYDPTVIAQARAAGYRGATTVVPGWARRTSDPFRLARLRVVAGTGPRALLRQIAAARHGAPPPRSYTG